MTSLSSQSPLSVVPIAPQYLSLVRAFSPVMSIHTHTKHTNLLMPYPCACACAHPFDCGAAFDKGKPGGPRTCICISPARFSPWPGINNYPMLYKSMIMRFSSGNLRANMQIYKQHGGEVKVHVELMLEVYEHADLQAGRP